MTVFQKAKNENKINYIVPPHIAARIVIVFIIFVVACVVKWCTYFSDGVLKNYK